MDIWAVLHVIFDWLGIISSIISAIFFIGLSIWMLTIDPVYFDYITRNKP
jgi:hypothetical protein